MTGRVRVLVWHRATPETGLYVVDAYHGISNALAGTPGLLRNELLRAPTDAASLVVASEWESMAAFQAWEQGPDHRDTTAPLRPYRDRERARPFDILEVVAAYAPERS
jgi:heme-degrading monooxygenase HmoA